MGYHLQYFKSIKNKLILQKTRALVLINALDIYKNSIENVHKICSNITFAVKIKYLRLDCRMNRLNKCKKKEEEINVIT